MKIHFIDVFDLGPRGMGRYRAHAALLTLSEMLYSSPTGISQYSTVVMNVAALGGEKYPKRK